MIEAKELRIGNLVNYIYSELDFSLISGLTYEVPQLDEITCFQPLYDELQPIPITEEWLLRFGFEPFYINGKLTHYRIGLYFIKFDGEDFYFELGKGMIIEVKHIHQLQNIYFALTQKELELK